MMQALPKPEEMERLAEHWRPYRSIGSWYMWRLCEVRPSTKPLVTAVAPARASSFCVPHELLTPLPAFVQL